MQYIDIGTNIWAKMQDVGDSFQLEVRADLSNLANPQQDSRTSMPIVGSLRSERVRLLSRGDPRP